MATTVELKLTPPELNLVLVALSQLPYVQVHELIGRIQTAAGPQLLAAVRSGDPDRSALRSGDPEPADEPVGEGRPRR